MGDCSEKGIYEVGGSIPKEEQVLVVKAKMESKAEMSQPQLFSLILLYPNIMLRLFLQTTNFYSGFTCSTTWWKKQNYV